MKRTRPPKRKAYLTRGAPPPRGKPARARKSDPAKRRWAAHRNDAYRAWIREQPCIVAGRLSGFIGLHHCGGRIECAHVKAVSTGGDDVGNCVPLCSRAHRWADWSPHRGGIQSFEQQFGLDLEGIGLYFRQEFLAAFPECRGAPQP